MGTITRSCLADVVLACVDPCKGGNPNPRQLGGLNPPCGAAVGLEARCPSKVDTNGARLQTVPSPNLNDFVDPAAFFPFHAWYDIGRIRRLLGFILATR